MVIMLTMEVMVMIVMCKDEYVLITYLIASIHSFTNDDIDIAIVDSDDVVGGDVIVIIKRFVMTRTLQLD